MSNKRSGLFVGGLLVGSAIGTVIGLLIAPRTGQQTRKLLQKSVDALPELVEDLSTSVQLQADRLSESALENWEETLDRLREAIAAGVEAYSTDRQTLSPSETENYRESQLPPRDPTKRFPQPPNSLL
jgi:gas vesicle protein